MSIRCNLDSCQVNGSSYDYFDARTEESTLMAWECL